MASTPVAAAPAEAEETITSGLLVVQDFPADIGGHYLPDETFTPAVMRSSPTFNAIIDGL